MHYFVVYDKIESVDIRKGALKLASAIMILSTQLGTSPLGKQNLSSWVFQQQGNFHKFLCTLGQPVEKRQVINIKSEADKPLPSDSLSYSCVETETNGT